MWHQGGPYLKLPPFIKKRQTYLQRLVKRLEQIVVVSFLRFTLSQYIPLPRIAV